MVASANELNKAVSGDDTEEHQPERRIIMGIEITSIQVSWGIIEYLPGGPTSRYLSCGVENVPEKVPALERLRRIGTAVQALISAYQPTDGVVENAFVSERVSRLDQRTALALGENRGVVLCTLAQCDVNSIACYTPAQVKAVVTGDSASPKEQVSFWVKKSLVDGNLIDLVPLDPTDALGLALTHAIVYGKEGIVVAAARHSGGVVPGDFVDGDPCTS